ncbi:hypothetical protein QBC38DRAFT_138505 [Podospora fimiseda]|uniref:Uncharacterized protein n=1 Tax=Podospora fimiseda TaxID=252190 RepID=A0AAN6YLD8_9PEZI|nr:hypothetical protein QBC38DRAFT_138505 [Podospora fimiseda]
MFSASLSAASVDWSNYEGLEDTSKSTNIFSSSYNHPESYVDFNFGGSDQLQTEGSGDKLTLQQTHKEKEVLLLRHKLQSGLLMRNQEPKEDEMQLMSAYIEKLEGLPDLEVSIIRSTQIYKVLRAILNPDKIPREDEFCFKERCQSLLNTWNKLLTTDELAASVAAGSLEDVGQTVRVAKGGREAGEGPAVDCREEGSGGSHGSPQGRIGL